MTSCRANEVFRRNAPFHRLDLSEDETYDDRYKSYYLLDFISWGCFELIPSRPKVVTFSSVEYK